MNEVTTWILAGLAGATLGGFFFGGLWWTVRRGVSSRRPALLFLGSFLVRTGATVGGFYLIADGRWQRLLWALLGFVVAREIVKALTRSRRAGSPPDAHPIPEREAIHAP